MQCLDSRALKCICNDLTKKKTIKKEEFPSNQFIKHTLNRIVEIMEIYCFHDFLAKISSNQFFYKRNWLLKLIWRKKLRGSEFLVFPQGVKYNFKKSITTLHWFHEIFFELEKMAVFTIKVIWFHEKYQNDDFRLCRGNEVLSIGNH